MVQGGETSPSTPPPPNAPRPPSAPPLPESTTVLRLEVPAGGVAAIMMDGKPILTKWHGNDDLRLHVPLRFNAAATMGTAEDVGMTVVGPQPAILFEDEGAGQDSVALARPNATGELHLLGGGKLVLSDGSDARFNCGDNTTSVFSTSVDPTVAAIALTMKLFKASGLLTEVEFGLPEDSTGSVLLRLGGEAGENIVTLGVDAGGEALTVGGAQRLLVDGVDVREKWQACEASR